MAKSKAKKPPKSKPKAGGTWARNYYISGFGRVNVGEAVSAASLEAWKAISKAEPKINHGDEDISTPTSE